MTLLGGSQTGNLLIEELEILSEKLTVFDKQFSLIFGDVGLFKPLASALVEDLAGSSNGDQRLTDKVPGSLRERWWNYLSSGLCELNNGFVGRSSERVSDVLKSQVFFNRHREMNAFV